LVRTVDFKVLGVVLMFHYSLSELSCVRASSQM
jgi:hypothetical protein